MGEKGPDLWSAGNPNCAGEDRKDRENIGRRGTHGAVIERGRRVGTKNLDAESLRVTRGKVKESEPGVLRSPLSYKLTCEREFTRNVRIELLSHEGLVPGFRSHAHLTIGLPSFLRVCAEGWILTQQTGFRCNRVPLTTQEHVGGLAMCAGWTALQW